ncbi:MAG TPA: ATP-binding protein [Solirubrobacteraceae bacterium]|nr:ATP-binding protein [Solirubrobacteraceae bacterium]
MRSRDRTATAPTDGLDRVERVFAELGLLPGETLRLRAREATVAALADTESQEVEQAASLQLARRLFVGTLGVTAGDPGAIARLLDRLADELGERRADVARELLGAELTAERTSASTREDLAAEALLALIEGGDRRLTRLGFDLHDGPLQELLLLGEDLRMFRGQLVSVLGDGEQAHLLEGRVDDLDARLVELEAGLRRISRAVHANFLLDRPFPEAVRELSAGFAARTGITPELRLEGDPAMMSPSQRIALLSVIGEALNNVREHGRGVRSVEVSIELGGDGVSVCVRDDGCGFEVEAALLDAARRGRIGLAGIHERVRLLDGECVVESRPGGPTEVALRLPRWEPLSSSATFAAGGE